MYCLLPFRFRVIGEHEILVNEPGNFLIVPRGTARRIAEKKIDEGTALYKDLVAGWFISDKPIPDLIDNLAVRLRTKKAFLDDFTSLHIFVLTLRCNQNCIYCQVSSREKSAPKSDMQQDDLISAINLMMQSPAQSITMEFQGGEPTLVPELLETAIIRTEEINQTVHKNITYVICSNCIDISQNLLDFCKKYNVFFSVSFDGPEFLHNHNRGKKDSFAKFQSGLAAVQTALGNDHVSALMTTSEESLRYPKDIVDSYLSMGFSHIFLRPLNPYGAASKSIDWNVYCRKFIAFFKESLLYIIEKNLAGIYFVEEFSTIILRKILTPFSDGFVDLQSPAGIINGVVVYNYDGFVYASDESRMLAEAGDFSFRLGPISAEYENLFYGEKAQKLSEIWCTECIAGCSDCAYQQYCGADPVRNHTMQRDSYGFRPGSHLCLLHMQIIDFIFELIISRRKEILPIFQSWVSGNGGEK